MKFRFLALPVVCALGACPSAVAAADSLAELQQKAARFNVILSLPTFETTPGEIASSLAQTLADGNAALDRLGKLSAAEVNFTNTAGALDQMSWRASLWADRVNFIKETSPNAAVRNAATDAIKKFQDWAVGLDYREDVYRALKAYAATGAEAVRRGSEVTRGDHARLPPGGTGFAKGRARRGGSAAQETGEQRH